MHIIKRVFKRFYIFPWLLAEPLAILSTVFWHGAVVDFLDFHVYNYHWPAFNVADSAIVLGVLFLVLDGYLHEKKHGL